MTVQKPAWSRKGLLHPQDLQFQSRFLEELLFFRLAGVAPEAWGIAALSFDRAALLEGVLRVTEVIGRFASGLPIMLPQGAPPLELALPQVLLGQAGAVVRLAVARVAADAPNVDDAGQKAEVRYLRSGAGRSVPTMRPFLRLVSDEAPAANSESMPLARVVSRGGRLEIQQELVPPLLDIPADSWVAIRTLALVDLLRARQDELLSVRQGRPLDLRAFHPGGIPQLVVLSALNQALAVLGAPRTAPKPTPRQLFQSLEELCSVLEVVVGPSDYALASRREPYKHEDAGPGFRQLLDRLFELVPVAARDPHIALPFQRRDAATFVATATDPTLFRKRVYLVASGSEEGFLRTHVPTYSKLAGPAAIAHVVQRSLPGVLMAAEFDPPPSLPSSANHACFRLDVRSEYWAEVVERGVLCAYVPQAPPDLTLTLYALER